MEESVDVIEAVRQILLHLDRLEDAGLSPHRTVRIRRETIFFLYEGGEARKWHFDRPHSARARALHREAIAARRRFGGSRHQVTYDHAIPLTTIWAGLRRATASEAELRHFLLRHVHGVVLLKEEDARLTAMGLASCMPPGAAPNDPLARYREARIKLEPDDEAKLQQQPGGWS